MEATDAGAGARKTGYAGQTIIVAQAGDGAAVLGAAVSGAFGIYAGRKPAELVIGRARRGAGGGTKLI